MSVQPASSASRTRAACCTRTLNGRVYARHPVRSHLVTPADTDAAAVVKRYVDPLPDGTSLVAVSERMVAITQGRSYPMTQIRPGRLARLLVRYVTRPGYGIGLGTPQTMQLAINEVGAPRILLAAAVSGMTKPFGVHGLFYRIAGPPGLVDRRPHFLHHPALQRVGDVRSQRSRRCGAAPLPRPLERRWRSSMPTTPAAWCLARAPGLTASSWSGSSPTIRSARHASRRRSA